MVRALREAVDETREEIVKEGINKSLPHSILDKSYSLLKSYTSYNLKPVINATGVVIHTNLGRSALNKKSLDNVVTVSQCYSNLEFNLESGERGNRYSHIVGLLKEITGAEDAMVVNNNAAAVMLCLTALAKDKEVIVSRGELVEIGGSFRIPDIISQSGAFLREVGTTNKTHSHDYLGAINENTAMILKVHQSNYKMIGFTEEVIIEDLTALSHKHNIPVMFDLGSGCLIDLKPYGIHTEPPVQDIVKKDVDLITFSGDKLLGGPQGGIIVGRKKYIEILQSHPLTRVVRVDKFTLSALEATLKEYVSSDTAIKNVPTLNMLLQDLDLIKKRARKIASGLRKLIPDANITVLKDSSQAGGGSLPGIEFQTYVIKIKPSKMSVNRLEKKLRNGKTPVITRVKDDMITLDSRTVMDNQLSLLFESFKNAL